MSSPSPSFCSSLCRGASALALACVLSFGLAGCQTALESGPLITDASYWQSMQERLKTVSSVRLRGTVNISYQAERYSTNYVYQSSAPGSYSLQLVTSFGNKLADLKVTPTEAVLIADNHTFTAESAQELFAQVVKIPLPLDHFQSIILGQALETSAFTSSGILYKSFVPNFEITYLDYLSLPESQISLPKEIDVVGPELHLIIKTRAVEELKLGAL